MDQAGWDSNTSAARLRRIVLERVGSWKQFSNVPTLLN